MSCDYRTEGSRDIFRTHSWWVSTLLSLEFTGVVKVEIYRFLFITWLLVRCVTWLCGWGPLILIHHTAKFGVHKSCESGDTGFYLPPDHNIEVSRDFVGGWGPLILSDRPAKFGVHRPYGTGNNGVYNISSNPFPFPIPTPMPRFQCRGLQMAIPKCFVSFFCYSVVSTRLITRHFLQSF